MDLKESVEGRSEEDIDAGRVLESRLVSCWAGAGEAVAMKTSYGSAHRDTIVARLLRNVILY